MLFSQLNWKSVVVYESDIWYVLSKMWLATMTSRFDLQLAFAVSLWQPMTTYFGLWPAIVPIVTRSEERPNNQHIRCLNIKFIDLIRRFLFAWGRQLIWEHNYESGSPAFARIKTWTSRTNCAAPVLQRWCSIRPCSAWFSSEKFHRTEWRAWRWMSWEAFCRRVGSDSGGIQGEGYSWEYEFSSRPTDEWPLK
jgi:hypothetical protein